MYVYNLCEPCWWGSALFVCLHDVCFVTNSKKQYKILSVGPILKAILGIPHMGIPLRYHYEFVHETAPQL